MSEATLAAARLTAEGAHPDVDLDDDTSVRAAAHQFCETLPYRTQPYCRRNWGGQLHSLCSYQGKLKPAIAHFLVGTFTRPLDVVLDPMAGVSTIPLEARLQGRQPVAGDLSEFAAVVSKAKLEAFEPPRVAEVLDELTEYIDDGGTSRLETLIDEQHAEFGLNGHVVDYFETQTLREVLLARKFFAARLQEMTSAEAVTFTALLHILHGNRPYALSRRSHPVTPLKPTGPAEYRSVVERIDRRLQRILPALRELEWTGVAYRSDYTQLPLGPSSVDAVITSPPFAQSLRFFSSNWMRLWLCGWNPADFRSRPSAFLDMRQARGFDEAYRVFLQQMARLIRPGGLLVLHVGETSRLDMAARIAALVEPPFETLYTGRECVRDTESHGLTDKGATKAHGFLFCRRA